MGGGAVLCSKNLFLALVEQNHFGMPFNMCIYMYIIVYVTRHGMGRSDPSADGSDPSVDPPTGRPSAEDEPKMNHNIIWNKQ